MAKPMTSEQIESELELITDSVRKGWEVVHARAAIRAAFTLGQDNGKAIILERAQSLIAPRFVDEKTSAIGAAVVAILAWVALVPGRSWAPQSDSCLLFGGADEPTIGDNVGRVQFCWGSDAVEAMTVAATWCTEHTKNSAPKVPDTLPAPPDEAHLTELAENGAAQDAAMKQSEDLGGF